MFLKIVYDTIKLQSHLENVIKMTSQNFPFLSPSITKSWLRSWLYLNRFTLQQIRN